MDWDDLAVFAVVAEELSFTNAAQRLWTSRAVTSRRVRKLEDLLGFRLLERNTARVLLTEAGRDVLDWVQRTEDSWSGLHRYLLARYTEQARSAPALLRIGACRVDVYRLPERLRELLPDTDVSVIEVETPQNGLHDVRDGKLSALVWERWPFTPVEDDRFTTSLTLMRAPIFVFLSDHHPHAADSEVDLKDLEGDAFIGRVDPGVRDLVTRVCHAAGDMTPRYGYITDDHDEVESHVRAGRAVDLGSPAFRPSDGITRRPIARSPRSRTILTWNAEQVAAASADAMAAAIKGLLTISLHEANPEMMHLTRQHPDAYPAADTEGSVDPG